MAAFGSAGAGFARAFATQQQIGQNRRQLKLQEEQIEQARAEKVRAERAAAIDKMMETANESFDTNLKLIGEIASKGGTDSPDFMSFVENSLAPVHGAAAFLEKQRAVARQFEANGEIPAGAHQLIPSGEELIAEKENLLKLTLFNSFLSTPEQEGLVDARKALAKTEAMLGRELRPEEREALAGVEGATPNTQNFWNPDTGEVTMVDFTADNAASEVDQLKRRGYIEMGLTVDSPDKLIGKKPVEEFVENEIAVKNWLAESERLREQLGDQNVNTGFAQSLIIGMDNVADQIVQIGQATGLMEDGVKNAENYDFSSWGDEAESNAAFRTNIINGAILLARAAEPGARLTNEDVQRQMDRLAVTGAKSTISSVLDEIDRATVTGLRNRHEVLTRRGIQLGPLDPELSEAAITPRLREVMKKMQSGTLTSEDVKSLSDEELLELQRQRR